MLTTPENNVKFTDEQTRQVTAWSQKLSVIQAEIKKAEEQSNVLSTEIKALESHRDYLTSENANLETKVHQLQEVKLDIEAEVVKSSEKLLTHAVETKKRIEHLSKAETGHAETEKTLTLSHERLEKRSEELNAKAARLSEQQLLVEKARDVFLKATESVVWSN